VARYVRSVTPFCCVESARDRGKGRWVCWGARRRRGAEAVQQFGGGRGGMLTRTWRLTVSLWNMAQISDLEVLKFRV